MSEHSMVAVIILEQCIGHTWRRERDVGLRCQGCGEVMDPLQAAWHQPEHAAHEVGRWLAGQVEELGLSRSQARDMGPDRAAGWDAAIAAAAAAIRRQT